MKKVFFVAGETSGDQHAAEVIREIRRIDPAVEVHAYGGDEMEGAGAKIHFPLPELASIGWDWVGKVFQFRRVGIELLEICKREGIETVVFVDFPGFNLRVAKAAKKSGMRVLYYIIPQVWAWRAGRLVGMKRDLDAAFVIFPFEEPLLREAGIETEFVGHPLADKLAVIRDRETILSEHGLSDLGDRTLVGLLPGSRRKEIDRLLPILVDAAKEIHKSRPDVHFILPLAKSISRETIESRIDSSLPLTLVEDPSPDFRAVLTFAVTKSGTSTLENAVLGVPQIVVYKGSALDAWFARRLVKVRWIGLANLIADREICPEFLQEECTAENLSRACLHYLEDDAARETMRTDLSKVRASLGGPGGAERTARAILARLR